MERGDEQIARGKVVPGPKPGGASPGAQPGTSGGRDAFSEAPAPDRGSSGRIQVTVYCLSPNSVYCL